MRRINIALLLPFLFSANAYAYTLTSDGLECLSEAEERSLKDACSNSAEDSPECEAASGWYFDSGKLRRAECDLALEQKKLEFALAPIRSALESLDQASLTVDGYYPTGYPLRRAFEEAHEAWLKYVLLHCNESAGPRGAGLAWHADVNECRIPLFRQRVEYLIQHWSLGASH